MGREDATAAAMWGCEFALPIPLLTKEPFGFLHSNRTLDSQMAEATTTFAFSHAQLDAMVRFHSERFSPVTSMQLDSLLDTALPDPTATSNTVTSTRDVTALFSSRSLLPLPVDEVDSGPRPLLKPERRMTILEMQLLSSFIFKNKQMGEAERKEEWGTAAGMWNNMAQLLYANPTWRDLRIPLHATHSDLVRGAVMYLNEQAELKAEEDVIQHQAQHPTIEWTPISSTELSFTEYESAVLKKLVEKWSTVVRKKRTVSWHNVQRQWYWQYNT